PLCVGVVGRPPPGSTPARPACPPPGVRALDPACAYTDRRDNSIARKPPIRPRRTRFIDPPRPEHDHAPGNRAAQMCGEYNRRPCVVKRSDIALSARADAAEQFLGVAVCVRCARTSDDEPDACGSTARALRACGSARR